MKTHIIDSVEVQRGSGNVFADLGLPDADKIKKEQREFLVPMVEQIVKLLSPATEIRTL